MIGVNDSRVLKHSLTSLVKTHNKKTDGILTPSTPLRINEG